jgi:Mrp family chromosome partitioning ATPase
MGRAADSVLLVVRAGRTSREAAVAVRQKLLEDGTPVAGSVLNDWNPRKSPGYYGHYAGASLSPRRVPTRKIA